MIWIFIFIGKVIIVNSEKNKVHLNSLGSFVKAGHIGYLRIDCVGWPFCKYQLKSMLCYPIASSPSFMQKRSS